MAKKPEDKLEEPHSKTKESEMHRGVGAVASGVLSGEHLEK